MSEELVPCIGGPTSWLRVDDPPPLEVEVDDGVYVLDDSIDHVRYVFIPH